MTIRQHPEQRESEAAVFRVVKRAQMLGLDRYPRFCTYLKHYVINPRDTEIRQILDEMIRGAELHNLQDLDLFRRTNPLLCDDLTGTIGLGFIPPQNVPWLIPPALLTSSMLVTGRSGGGKTNLILLMSYQLLQNRLATVKFFDRKMDYACLSRFPDFVYWMLEDHYTNWIEPPPGVHFRKWIPTLFEIFANYGDIRIAGRNLLTNATLWLCKERNSTDTGTYPTLKDVLNVIRHRKYPIQSHQARYKETVINRISGLLDIFGDHVCSHKRLNWKTFANSSWAISLDGIPTDYQNLFITVTSAKLLRHRMAKNQRSFV